ncbi:MAG: hypothetical protein ACIARR_04460, partial [Phycisphaerales bacterium JB059]
VSPAVSAAFLSESVGGLVRERLLDPGLIDGARAHAIGLAHEVVERREAVAERALRIAHELAGKPRSGIGATKRWLEEVGAAQSALGADAGRAGLEASLSIVGNEEERARLDALWGKGRSG